MISTALFAGVWLAAHFEIPAWSAALAFAFAALSAAASISLRAGFASRWALVALSAMAGGALRFAVASPQPPEHSIVRLSGERVIFEGVVAEAPEHRATTTHLRVRLTRLIKPSDETVASDEVVLVRALTDESWRYGDVVRVEGVVDAPPRVSAFDYRRYLAYRGVFAWVPRPSVVQRIGYQPDSALYAQLLAVRDAVRTAVHRAVPMPESALLNGILIGDDRLLPESLKEDFRTTGTAHIVAISGANVSLVIALVVVVLGRMLHRRAAAAAALPVIALYVLFIGAPASAVRAASMTALGLVGQLFWRRGFTLNTLFAACALIVLANPFTLFDTGFQLSAAATLGLTLFADRWATPTRAWLERHVSNAVARPALSAVLDGTLVTLAAQLATLPLLVVMFNQISLVALLSNALILPLQPPIMLLGALTALVGMVAPEIASWVALPVRVLLTLTIRAVRWTADFPLAAIPVHEEGTLALVAGYAMLVGALWFRAQPHFVQRGMLMTLRRDSKRWLTVTGGTLVLGVGLFAWFQRPPDQVRLVLRDSNALMHTPSGAQLLFISRGDALALVRTEQPFWDREIEVVVLSHADALAREAALPVLQRYRVSTLVMPAQPSEEDAELNQAWRLALRNVQRVVSGTLDRHTLGEAITATVVARQPARGMQAIGVQIRRGTVLVDLAGEGKPARIEPQTALLFVTPRGVNAAQLTAASPRWVVWTDSSGRSPAPASGTHSLWLRQARTAVFLIGEQHVQRAR
ncbi:MAG: ComEC family competence protein [Thermoflexales bacterium]|nr:ComEC family competence protein [Thermoflexales bacterium]